MGWVGGTLAVYIWGGGGCDGSWVVCGPGSPAGGNMDRLA